MYLALFIYLCLSGIFDTLASNHRQIEHLKQLRVNTAKSIVQRLLNNSHTLEQVITDYDKEMRKEIKNSIKEYIWTYGAGYTARQLAYLDYMIYNL